MLTNQQAHTFISCVSIFLLKTKVRDMAKVWKDANEAIKMIHDIEDSKLRELDIEMRKKPKFDHIADVGNMIKRK